MAIPNDQEPHMKNPNRIVSIVFGCLCFTFASQSPGQDWPQWRGPNRDGKAAGFNAPQTWPKELNKKWNVPVGNGDATPALVGDKIYVFAREGGAEVTRCLEAATGKKVWEDKYESLPAEGPAGRHPGPRSSPTVADGKVVTFGVRGVLSCLDADSGKVVWRKHDMADWPRFFTSMSPLIVNGLCVAQVGGDRQGGAVLAYDLASGDQKWKWSGEAPAYSSPVLMTLGDTKMVVAETAKSIAGLAVTDGKQLWDIAFAPRGRSYNAATPIVDGSTIIGSSQSEGVKAWKIEKNDGGYTVKELWQNPDNGVQFDTPVLKNDLIYGITARGNLFCINASNGQTAWTSSTGDRNQFGSVVDAGQVLVALTPKAELVVFPPSDKEFKETAKYKVADSETYAYPILSANRIYIKDADSLTLWTID